MSTTKYKRSRLYLFLTFFIIGSWSMFILIDLFELSMGLHCEILTSIVIPIAVFFMFKYCSPLFNWTENNDGVIAAMFWTISFFLLLIAFEIFLYCNYGLPSKISVSDDVIRYLAKYPIFVLTSCLTVAIYLMSKNTHKDNETPRESNDDACKKRKTDSEEKDINEPSQACVSSESLQSKELSMIHIDNTEKNRNTKSSVSVTRKATPDNKSKKKKKRNLKRQKGKRHHR